MATASSVERFYNRFVPAATPGALGAIRIVVCVVALTIIYLEELPSAAKIPLEIRRRMGLLEIFYALPIGFHRLASSELALTLLELATCVALLAGAVGFRTRVAIPLAAFGSFLIGGIVRQYAWFFHTGLIPFYLLTALSLTACGDGWSVDVWRRRRRGESVPDPDLATAAYGWSRYACWMVVALPYLFAGLSKLRSGPPVWWTASNFKRLVIASSLKPMQFDFDLGLALIHWPDWAWSLLGLVAVLTEVGYGSVLFSRLARRFMPPLTVMLHVGILLFQNILFLDLILLQLIFFDFDRRSRGREIRVSTPAEASSTHRSAGLALASVALFLGGWWVGNKDYYPLTAMKMFAGNVSRSTRIEYQTIWAQTKSGDRFEARLEDAIGVLHDTRYRELIAVFGKRKGVRRKTAKLLDAVAAEWNQTRSASNAIVAFEIQNRNWDYAKNPDDLERGRVSGRYVHKVRPLPTTSAKPAARSALGSAI
jgi:hypothetical protein